MPLIVRPELEAWAQTGAELILSAARAAAAVRGRFSLALAGGQTPDPVYDLISRPPLAEQMPWAATHLFWGDERCVLPDDPRSNFGRCRDWLSRLAGAGLAQGQVHRVSGEIAPPELAARRYEQDLRLFFAGGPPVFDLVLLGLGADGHVASLFPGGPALWETGVWAMAVQPPPGAEPEVARVTLTLPVINAARQVVFLVRGAGKAGIAARARTRSAPGTPELPASLVRPVGGEPLWLLDRRAAGGSV